MTRNQIILLSTCIIAALALYVFTDHKKPEDAAKADEHKHEMPAQNMAEALDIQSYIEDITSRIEDNKIRTEIEQLQTEKAYNQLAEKFAQLDKPLAVAYYLTQNSLAEQKEDKLVKAGDYNMMLTQSAPDAKALNFLINNAIEAYEAANKVNPGNAGNRIKLAGAYMQQGAEPMKGVSMLLDIVKQDSTNVDAQMMLGRFGMVSGQYDKAIARFEKILYLQPQNSEALLMSAQCYESLGNKEKAVEMLEKCKNSLSDPELRKEIDKYIKEIK